MNVLKIRARFLGGFAAATILCVAALCGLVFEQTRTIGKAAKRITSDTMPSTYLSGQLQIDTLLRYTLLTDYLNPANRDKKTEIAGKIDSINTQIDQTLREYESLIDSPEDRRLFNALQSTRAPYEESYRSVLDLSRAGKQSQARSLIGSQFIAQRNAFLKAADAEVIWNKADADDSSHEILGALDWSLIEVLFSLVLGASTGLFALSIRKSLSIERRLREGEEEFRAVFEQSPVGMCMSGLDGRLLHANIALCRMLGYDEADLVGRSWIELTHPDDRATSSWISEQLAKFPTRCVEIEKRYLRRSGEVVWVRTSIAVATDSKGVPRLNFVHVDDITKRKQAEDLLRNAQEFAQATIDALTSHICVLDETGTVIAVNQAWRGFATTNRKPDSAEMETQSGCFDEFSEGVNYLAVCDGATGPEAAEAAEFATGIRSVLHGDCGGFTQEYPCDSPHERRWFIGRVTRFMSNGQPRIIIEHINITDRKLAEEVLRESEERFRVMADSCPAMMWVTGTSGEIEFRNRASRKFFDAADGEDPECNRQMTIHPDDASEFYAAFDEAVAKHAPFKADARVRRGDGEWRLLGLYAEPRISLAGTFMGHIGLSADITDRREAQEALLKSEEKFRELTENIREVFWMMNAEGNDILYVSPAYEQIWGRSCASLYKSPLDWLDAIHPEDRQGAHEIFARQMLGEAIDSEYRIVTPDGSEKWIRDRAFPIRASDGKILRVAGIAEEVTERKRAQEALRDSEEKFRQLADNIHEAFWVRDAASGRFLYVSPSYENVWARTCESLYQDSDSWTEAIHPDDLPATRLILEQQRSGESSESEFRILTAGGIEKWVRNKAFPIFDHASKLIRIVGIAEEITEWKCFEAELIEARTAADHANAAKSRFLANMSHEIRTPMNGIIGMNQLLLETELTAEQRRYVEVVQTSGRTLLTLIDDILDFSKVEAGRIDLEERNFDIGRVVEDVVQLMSAQAAKKGIHIESRLAPEIPLHLRGDSYRLRQILTNLCANAVKFTGKGQVTLNVVSEGLDQHKAAIRFTVADTGIGISPDRVSTLFSPFVQADSSTTRKFGGTGLGLAISKQLVELMGGAIGVNSRPGEGSSFWFTLTFALAPRAETASREQPRMPIANAPERPIRLGNGQRILVAEDNPTNREVILALLKKLKYQVDAVPNGVLAVTAVSKGEYAAVLMDCEMPVMDGYEATRTIRQSLLSAIPIIALTANAMPADRERCLREGMNEYLAKPVEFASLAEALAHWISGPASLPAGLNAQDVDKTSRPTAFDQVQLLRRLLGDRELAGTVLAGFTEVAPQQLSQLQVLIAANNAPAVRLQAHNLKGAAATVGAESLHPIMLAIETSAAGGQLAPCAELLARAAEEFERFKSKLEREGWIAKADTKPQIEETSNV